MSRRTESIGRSYFDELYARDPDPWRFASSPYETEKYAATLAALPPGEFETALEVGCSIGVFTRALAGRCTSLLAIDVAEEALQRARAMCQATHVRFENRRVPEEWPTGHYDLIVLSEILYYLAQPDLNRVAAQVRQSLNAQGTVILVHYLGETDYPVTGDVAATAFIAAAGLQSTHQDRAPLYRIDVLQS